MDQIDMQLLKLLTEDSRMSYTELAERIGISETAIRRRVKKLVDEKVITQFTIKVDQEKIGKSITAFVGVDVGGEIGPVAGSELMNKEEISELYTITGDFDIIMKVTCRTVKDLEKTIEFVRGMDFTQKTKTYVVLNKLKDCSTSI
ncbi:MAG: Lrp/AsnC family transcriptional regulator [Candidatus Methanomethylicia archaeon]|nr:Lrp/AsnC family transcriptional regulator [Candidatus Methanomethylicia archaeon]